MILIFSLRSLMLYIRSPPSTVSSLLSLILPFSHVLSTSSIRSETCVPMVTTCDVIYHTSLPKAAVPTQSLELLKFDFLATTWNAHALGVICSCLIVLKISSCLFKRVHSLAYYQLNKGVFHNICYRLTMNLPTTICRPISPLEYNTNVLCLCVLNCAMY